MKRIGWLISKYLVQAIVPYFVFSWLLLSVILFVQQASRFADIFFSVNIPTSLIWQLSLALVPNVIAFTCPMAMLVGTIIGLSKMQEDSELVAIRAAGVGNLQIAVPIIMLGVVLSSFAFLVNLKGVPIAAKLVRNVALQTAIKKLESPIEPGVFNTEIAGYTIYVKGGDIETGRWRNVFIYSEDPANGVVRLITSQRGRIDTTDQTSELVLENASVSSIPRTPGVGKYVTENIGDVRLAIKTKRSELLASLGDQQGTAEELGLTELSEYAKEKSGADRIEAQILLQRRLLLSVSPLIFCLLGTAMILRFNRGGRGFATLMALAGLVCYYLLTFLGEQLARTGKLNVYIGGAIPVVVSALAIFWFMFSTRITFLSGLTNRFSELTARRARPESVRQTRNLFVDLTTGLRDFDLIANLVRYFALALGFLTSVFMIFTAFELWRFAGVMDNGTWLLTKYLVYLIPFVYLQLAPSAAMIATIATYVIKSRQNEIVTWTSAGQSVYRLMVPCFLLMIFLGFMNFGVQEWIAPKTNPVQDTLRTQIRKGGVVTNASGKYWVANDRRIYSFEMDTPSARNNAPNSSASDNEKEIALSSRSGRVEVYASASAGESESPGLMQKASDTSIPAKKGSVRSGRLSGAAGPKTAGVPVGSERPEASQITLNTAASDNVREVELSRLWGTTEWPIGEVPAGRKAPKRSNNAIDDSASDNVREVASSRLWRGTEWPTVEVRAGRNGPKWSNNAIDQCTSDNEMASVLRRPFGRAALPAGEKGNIQEVRVSEQTIAGKGGRMEGKSGEPSPDGITHSITQRAALRHGEGQSANSGSGGDFTLTGTAAAVSTESSRPSVPPLAMFNAGTAPVVALACASDNEQRPDCPSVCVRNLTVYEFASDNNGLQSVYRGGQAQWADDRIIFSGPVEHSVLREGRISTETVNGGELVEPDNPFTELGGKPSHMTIPEIRHEVAASESDAARRNFAVALEKRYSTLFLPFVIALFTAPFALSLQRSGRVVTVGYAIGLWLVYTGVTYIFEEFGLNGFLTPAIAVYSPIGIFAMLGVYLLSKVRT